MCVGGEGVCVGGEGERERERERGRERECVCGERESACGGREVVRQKKDGNTHTRATKQKRVGIGWFVLWLVVDGCGWLWLVVVGVEFSRNCKSPVCEVMNSYDRDNC